MPSATSAAPQVSVIVPLYNVADYVGECIASLLMQTFSDFEAVCVDDGSTDDSLARAREVAGADPRFVFVERANGGLSAARNTGLAHASGEYVCFLDSDDYYAPATLERLVGRMREDNLDLLDFSASTFYEGDMRKVHEEDYYAARSDVPGVMSGPELFVEHQRRGSYVSSACMHMIRRLVLESSGLEFREGLLHEDELFSPLLYAQAGRAAFLNEPFYRRRMRANSIMTVERGVPNIRSEFAIVQMLEAWLLDNAQRFDAAFIDAFALNIAHLCSWSFIGVQSLEQRDPEELQAYIDSLDVRERISFDLSIRYANFHSAREADRRVAEVYDSITYRVGRLATAVPRAARSLIGHRFHV